MHKLRIALGLSAVFVVAFAGTAVANHVYNDVPSHSVFHEEIAEIGDAGCAEGFPGGLFKPEDPVKRQQMARFLSRCGTRVSSASGSATVTASSHPDVAPATIQARADGFVFVTATGTATVSSGTNCPCEAIWALTNGTVNGDMDGRGEIPAAPVDTGNAVTSMAVSHVFPISQGETTTFAIRPSTSDGSATIFMEGRLTAIFVPFDGAPAAN